MDSVCWNITKECDKHCEFCFRETNESDLPLEENKKILENLIKQGVKKISWSGGEPTEYKGLEELLKVAKENNIYNKMVTNASHLKKEKWDSFLMYLDEIVFSIDFVDDTLNQIYGRGRAYYKLISEMIPQIKAKYPKCLITINTVIMKPNIVHFDELYQQVVKLNISKWKLIQFCYFRGLAKERKEKFYIEEEQFNEILNKYKILSNNFQIEGHTANEMEKNHVVITPSGKIIQ